MAYGKILKKSHGLLVTLPKELTPASIVDQSAALTAAYSIIKGISFDRPIQERKLRFERKITKAIINSDPKLKSKASVKLTAVIPTPNDKIPENEEVIISPPKQNLLSTKKRSYASVVKNTSSNPQLSSSEKSPASATNQGQRGKKHRIRKPDSILGKAPKQTPRKVKEQTGTSSFFHKPQERKRPPQQLTHNPFTSTAFPTQMPLWSPLQILSALQAQFPLQTLQMPYVPHQNAQHFNQRWF